MDETKGRIELPGRIERADASPSLLIGCATAAILTNLGGCHADAVDPSAAARNEQTRQVSLRCGLGPYAVAIDPQFPSASGRSTMTIRAAGFSSGSTTWRCLSTEARKLGYDLAAAQIYPNA